MLKMKLFIILQTKAKVSRISGYFYIMKNTLLFLNISPSSYPRTNSLLKEYKFSFRKNILKKH